MLIYASICMLFFFIGGITQFKAAYTAETAKMDTPDSIAHSVCGIAFWIMMLVSFAIVVRLW